MVEEILDAGKDYNYGLEAGSKPELMIALAMHEGNQRLIICNGYKDDDYIRLALLGRKLGKKSHPRRRAALRARRHHPHLRRRRG